ncbi:TrbC/VirB2 family protein [Deinococcus soli (ex Cha et al. 2016)]|uniref:Type IV secretory pathway VirB2 component (Pilin) n=2 Tax=Deinococcus soli (ex Cha et al. 2016) TaxID=1309411 RepID=A0ACC6KGE5_9DEIO|nr:TrbC/VirB2 family protein [Deinococcus soli (ex Cha et al. 2016)]MDR6218514.1 type IV secretory pathway VirB2 component (pilin) [Deinococcus soli (ex Cha et al. 2016)]MDR6329254.1 type IV secretory pathway VirB2 component (pilin) [Deinococcus soli (ex Cha et al. 2016)]MDR6751527.1 type IV secretory pathway VirB2 component (pilin) [Deinococcus soli (ex Cha et al. 2016)]
MTATAPLTLKDKISARAWMLSQNQYAKAFTIGALAAAGMGTEAGATATSTQQAIDLSTPINRVVTPICQVYTALTGPVGLGIILLCIVVAGLLYATGNKKSTGMILSALIGAVIVFSARALLGIAANSGSFSCGGTATAAP